MRVVRLDGHDVLQVMNGGVILPFLVSQKCHVLMCLGTIRMQVLSFQIQRIAFQHPVRRLQVLGSLEIEITDNSSRASRDCRTNRIVRS